MCELRSKVGEQLDDREADRVTFKIGRLRENYSKSTGLTEFTELSRDLVYYTLLLVHLGCRERKLSANDVNRTTCAMCSARYGATAIIYATVERFSGKCSSVANSLEGQFEVY